MKLKKSRMLKFISMVAVLIIMLCFNGMIVSAETVQDGISITVATNKEEYKSDEEVKLTITLKNSNDFEVSDLKIENVLPEGISLTSGEISKESISLKSNEEYTINLSVKKSSINIGSSTNNVANGNNGNNSNHSSSTSQSVNDTSTNQINGSPNLGENNIVLIVLIIMLIAIIIITICCMKDKKKYSKFLSILMCIGVLNVFGITGVIYATSENNQKSFTYEYTYKIDNVDYIHKIIISYGLENNNTTTETEVIKDIESTLQCIIKNDFSNGFYYMNSFGVHMPSIDMKEMDIIISSKVSFNIKDIEVENNEAIAEIEFKYPDLSKKADIIDSDNLSSIIDNTDTITTTVYLYLLKLDNHWLLLENKGLMNSFSGGLLDLRLKSEEEIYQGLLEEEN